MPTGLSRIVVVGAGLAGLRTIERLRRQGFDGRLTLIGDEPYEPYDRPPLSKGMLWSADLDGPHTLSRKDLRTDLDVDLRLGQPVRSVDPVTRKLALADGTAEAYDALVLATGSCARGIGPAASELANVHTLRSYDDCVGLGKALRAAGSLAVVGGGFIGCEVATGAVAAGLAVTMFEPLPVPMGRSLGRVPGQRISELHAAAGLRICTGIGVIGFDGAQRAERIRLSDGSSVQADVVLLGLGAIPASEWLRGSGIAVDRGVLCDEFGRTSVAGVWAAGDVAQTLSRPTGRYETVEHWLNAHEQASIVADNILTGDGELTAYEPLPYFWSEQNGVRVQVLGRLDPEAAPAVVELHSERPSVVYLYGEARLTGAVSLNAPAQLMSLRPLLLNGGTVEDAREHLITRPSADPAAPSPSQRPPSRPFRAAG